MIVAPTSHAATCKSSEGKCNTGLTVPSAGSQGASKGCEHEGGGDQQSGGGGCSICLCQLVLPVRNPGTYVPSLADLSTHDLCTPL